MNQNLFRRSSLKATVLAMASLAIVVLPMTARVAEGLNPTDNWPKLKSLLHEQAGKMIPQLGVHPRREGKAGNEDRTVTKLIVDITEMGPGIAYQQKPALGKKLKMKHG